ncbi:MAG: hypothetical protein ACYCTY_11120 [Sulfuricella sp.]
MKTASDSSAKPTTYNDTPSPATEGLSFARKLPVDAATGNDRTSAIAAGGIQMHQRPVWNRQRIGAGIIPNGSFPATRLRALDPFEPIIALPAKVHSTN